MFAIILFSHGISASNQITQLTNQVAQLRYEHEALKKNLKELDVLEEEQEPEKK